MNDFIEADLCVKCGLCLPHCPTYQQTLDENESPRGRIALIQGWSKGQLESSETLQKHLDHCLLCRSCEKACPAFVPYGKLMDRYRSESGSLGRSRHKKLQALLADSRKLRWLSRFLKLYKRSGLGWLTRSSGILKVMGLARYDAMLPRLQSISSTEQETAENQKEVALFVGCMGRLLDEQTVASAKIILNRWGFKTTISEKQTCCGAIALHDGDAMTAQSLAMQNSQTFSEQKIVVTIASGCGSTLSDYHSSFPEQPEIEEMAGKITDISHFLMENWPAELPLKAIAKTVFIHTPCTLKNVLKQASGPEKLLAKIPELMLHKDSAAQHCCGAAGSYMLDYPETANSLADNLIDQVERLNPDYLVSSNIGCAMHLRAAIVARGLKTEVVHPIVLLEKALL